MAETIYFSDGSMEVVLGDPGDVLRRVIYDRLGPDAERFFTAYVDEIRHPFAGASSDDYESIADDLNSLCWDTLHELEAIQLLVESPKSKKPAILKAVQTAVRNLKNSL